MVICILSINGLVDKFRNVHSFQILGCQYVFVEIVEADICMVVEITFFADGEVPSTVFGIVAGRAHVQPCDFFVLDVTWVSLFDELHFAVRDVSNADVLAHWVDDVWVVITFQE